MKKFSLILILSLSVLLSCSKKIEPINYGIDSCTFCSMNIVDKSHASQLVTNKGKNLKFDAAECLIHYLSNEKNENNMLHILTADYLSSGELIDVKEAIFIISPNIPSPMGAYLSATKSKEEAMELINENSGELFNWEEIKKHISNNSLPHHN